MAMTGYPLHEVSAPSLPDDARRVCPLIGNDELKLVIDARGAMHDFAPQGSWPPPRIVWTGRRHNLRQDRYSSNLFEWGFLDVRLEDEDALPPVTGWRQRLHPREGYVETVIQRGQVEERTISFVHLEKNLLVIHREYVNLPADRSWHIHANYTFCHVGTEEIPFRTIWSPAEPWDAGISAETTADGLQVYHGRIALFTDQYCKAESVANRLELSMPLRADGSVTIYLSLADDLGVDPQLLHIPDGSWMSPLVREVNRENLGNAEQCKKPDATVVTVEMLDWVHQEGFAGVFATHRAAWERFWEQIPITLPEAEEQLRAVFETQLYTLRCSYSHYSLPANPFNSSWGAAYFWDERYGMEGLMACGSMEMPARILEWRRRILPFCTQMTAGRGARYVSAAVESGSMISDRNGTNFYEFPLIGVIANYLWQYCRYQGDEATLRRYYPIIRECAEFYRNWLLVELPGNNLMVVPSIDIDEGHYPVQDGPALVCGAALTLHLASVLAEKLEWDDPEQAEWKRLGEMAVLLARSIFREELLDGGPLQVRPLFYNDLEIQYLPAPAIEQDQAIRVWREQYLQAHAPVLAEENVTGEIGMLPEWSWGYLSNAHLCASCGQPERAEVNLRNSLHTMMDFGALNESATPDLTVVHHPWFTTGAGAFVRAITRMLLYPKDEEIFILPGVPASWTDLHFTMPAHGGVKVTVQVTAGRLVTVQLTAGSSEQRRVVHLPKRFLPVGFVLTQAVTVLAEDAQLITVAVQFTGCVDLLISQPVLAQPSS